MTVLILLDQCFSIGWFIIFSKVFTLHPWSFLCHQFMNIDHIIFLLIIPFPPAYSCYAFSSFSFSWNFDTYADGFVHFYKSFYCSTDKVLLYILFLHFSVCFISKVGTEIWGHLKQQTLYYSERPLAIGAYPHCQCIVTGLRKGFLEKNRCHT